MEWPLSGEDDDRPIRPASSPGLTIFGSVDLDAAAPSTRAAPRSSPAAAPEQERLAPSAVPLPRPRPPVLNLPSTPAAQSAAATPPPVTAGQPLDVAWPLFHSPRGPLPPVSPSPVTSSLSARLPFPTGAGQAALATQPSQDDGYKDECLGDDFLSTHWLPPSHERAERYRKANIFQGGKAPVLSKLLPRCGKRGSSGAAAAASDPDGEVGAAEAGEVNGDGCDAQGQPPEGQAAEESGQEPVDVDLAQLGVGAELHFDLLKAFLRGFAVLLLLNIPALLLYRSGARLAKENADLLGSYVFTLGNIGQERNVLNGTALSTTFPLRAPVLNLELELSHKEAKTLLASMEVATCLVLAFLAVSVSNRITQAKQRHRRRVLTTKDFAVYVTNLPTDVTKAEIIEHFSELYPLDRPDWKGRAPPAHSGRPKLPVQDLAHVGGDQRYEGKWVADVVLARRNGRILRTALEHKDKALEIRRLRAQMKRYGPATAPAGKVDPARFARYRRQLQALEDRMRRVAQQLERDPRVAEAEQECVGAFVTFEYPESAQRCLDDYNSMNLLHLCCCFPHRLLFNGRDRLKIRPAPAPDDVMWENLEVTDWVRWLRCLVVYIAALLVLGVGFLVIIILTHNKTAASERVPDFTMCENEIPSLYTPDGVFPGTVTLEVPPWIDEARVMCSWAFPESNSFYGVYSFGASWSLPVAYYDVGACKDNPCPRPGASSYCPCLVSANDTAAAGFELPRCQTVGCLSDAPGRSCKSFPYEWIASCYCLQRLKSLMDNRFSLGWFTSLLNDHDLAMCKSVAQSLVYGALMQLALSLFTLAMSTFILPPAIKAITAWEKHRSADEEASQNLMRLFVAQFLNLAILLLIVYGGHPMVQQASEDPNSPLWARVLWTLGIFRGPYTEMDSGWYSVVGTQLHLNALIAALSPHAWPLFAYFVVAPAQRLYARLTEERWGVPPFAMQRDLNALYVGPAFDVATRAAQMLATAFVALLFSAGLPLLLAMAALAFALSFAVDYFLLLRYYGRPPHRDERLHRKLSRCMPYAILLHLGMAIWMLSNDDLVGKAPTRLDEAAAAAAANSFFSGGDVVTAGIARFTQPHIWPLTLIFLLPLGYIVLSDILPSRQLSALLLGLRAVFMATCYGDGGGRVLGRKRSRRVSSEMQLDVRKDNGYSKVFERPLPPERLAPGPYHPPTSPQADTAGWQEALDEYGVPVLRKLRDGHLQSARSPSIQPYRRTWELLKANGLWSYELHRSPRYRDAVLAFVSDFCPPATSTVGKSLRGSLWAGDGRQAQWQSKMLVMEADEEEQEE